MQMVWLLLHPKMTADHLGYIPSFLDEDDPRPARDQFDANYANGGGWRPYKGFTFRERDSALTHPGDPPLKPLAMTMLREEMVLFYRHDWVAIVQPDKSFEVCRMD